MILVLLSLYRTKMNNNHPILDDSSHPLLDDVRYHPTISTPPRVSSLCVGEGGPAHPDDTLKQAL